MDHTHGHLDYFINHFLKVGLTQNLKTVALRTLATIDLFYFIICEDPHDLKKIIELALVEDLVTYDFTLYLRVCDHTI